jgi:anti-sigma-K factor RskA
VSQRSGQTPGHDELRDELAAYALGALEEGEAERLRAHLETCEDCRRHLVWLGPAVELLPRTIEQLEPPPRLRESLMDVVRSESPSAAAAREPARRAAPGWWRGLGLSLRRPVTAVAAAAALVVGAVAGYLINDSSDSSNTTTFAASPAPRVAEVTGTLERDGDSGILRVRGMPSLAGDRVYEVWVQRDSELEPSSLFVPRSDHTADAAVPRSLDGADAVLVTEEPRGGSRQPTSAPLLSVELN